MNDELHIDALDLQLPAGFERRGPSIARHATRELGELMLADRRGAADVRLGTLRVGPVTAHPGEANAVIGRRIARQIHRELHDARSLP